MGNSLGNENVITLWLLFVFPSPVTRSVIPEAATAQEHIDRDMKKADMILKSASARSTIPRSSPFHPNRGWRSNPIP